MDKFLVALGIGVMLIGIGFGAAAFGDPNSEGMFFHGAAVWVVGGISTVLGLTIFSKEEGFLTGR